MFSQWMCLVPPEVTQLGLVLFLSFLIGLEREELKRGGRRIFGGVRTFPLLGLVGYVIALLSKGQVLPVILGFGVVGAFLMLSYWHKLSVSQEVGVTTEVSGLVVYLVGALVCVGHLWMACALVVVSLLLLELKEALEGLTERIAPEEVMAFTKFLLLTLVILPLVPNREFGFFQINPFKTWLVVVAVSGVSYASYVILKLVKGKGGIFATAVLGGLYSSTVTTVVLAKRASGGNHPHEHSGSILTASGLMYFRIVVLIWLFNPSLAKTLTPSFLGLALIAILGGWLWHRLPDPEDGDAPKTSVAQNPLELRAAFFFALIFLGMLVFTRLAVSHLGRSGVYALGAIMGAADVDPFIMGMTSSAGASTSLSLAGGGILLAVACNNLAKGCYAFFFSRNAAGKWSLWLLVTLAALSLVPLFWI